MLDGAAEEGVILEDREQRPLNLAICLVHVAHTAQLVRTHDQSALSNQMLPVPRNSASRHESRAQSRIRTVPPHHRRRHLLFRIFVARGCSNTELEGVMLVRFSSTFKTNWRSPYMTEMAR